MRQKMLVGLSLKRRTTFHSESREGERGRVPRGLGSPFSFDSSWRWRGFPVNERDPVSPDEKRDNKRLVYSGTCVSYTSEAVTDRIACRRRRKIASSALRNLILLLILHVSDTHIETETRTWKSYMVVF